MGAVSRETLMMPINTVFEELKHLKITATCPRGQRINMLKDRDGLDAFYEDCMPYIAHMSRKQLPSVISLTPATAALSKDKYYEWHPNTEFRYVCIISCIKVCGEISHHCPNFGNYIIFDHNMFHIELKALETYVTCSVISFRLDNYVGHE